jgi:hypothetical protein
MIGNLGTPTEPTFHPEPAAHRVIDAQSKRSKRSGANSGDWIERASAEYLALTDEGDALSRFPGESYGGLDATSARPSRIVGRSSAEPPPACAADMVGQLVRAANDIAGQLRHVDATKMELRRELVRLEELVQAASVARRQAEEIVSAKRPIYESLLARAGAATGLIRDFAAAFVARSRTIAAAAAMVGAMLFLLNRSISPTPQNPMIAATATLDAAAPPARSEPVRLPTSSLRLASNAMLHISIPKPRRAAIRVSHSLQMTQSKTEALAPSTSLAKRNAESASVESKVANAALREAQFVGTLAIESDPPGAAVLVDRQPVGETPTMVSKSRAGSHVVWIERAGYLRWTSVVSVAADKTTRVSVKLQRDAAQ